MNSPATLTGLAVGDALGMPFETCHFSDKKLAEWDGSFQASEFHGLKPGQWTDDTQMAVALTGSLLYHRTYAPSDVAKRYLAIYRSGDFRGIGSTTRKAMERLQRGMHWVKSGVPDAYGNGTAMRIAPLGLFLHNDIESVAAFAEMDAGITHDSLEAREGSKIVALAIAALVEGRADRETVLPRVLDWTRDSVVKARLVSSLSSTSGNTLQDLITMGTGASVVETVPAAFRAFCGTTSFEEAITVAIQAGGDTDTVAAITGALAGTFYGTDQVDPWMEHLEDGLKLRKLEKSLFNEAPPVYGQACVYNM